MGDVVNLNRERKRAVRENTARQAEVNRMQFGRTKFERARDEQRTKRTKELLDQHRITGDVS